MGNTGRVSTPRLLSKELTEEFQNCMSDQLFCDSDSKNLERLQSKPSKSVEKISHLSSGYVLKGQKLSSQQGSTKNQSTK
jgi:hypothetical protein